MARSRVLRLRGHQPRVRAAHRAEGPRSLVAHHSSDDVGTAEEALVLRVLRLPAFARIAFAIVDENRVT